MFPTCDVSPIVEDFSHGKSLDIQPDFFLAGSSTSEDPSESQNVSGDVFPSFFNLLRQCLAWRFISTCIFIVSSSCMTTTLSEETSPERPTLVEESYIDKPSTSVLVSQQGLKIVRRNFYCTWYAGHVHIFPNIHHPFPFLVRTEANLEKILFKGIKFPTGSRCGRRTRLSSL